MALNEQICSECGWMTPEHLVAECEECGGELDFMDVCDWCGEPFQPRQVVEDCYFIIVTLKGSRDGAVILRGTAKYHEHCAQEDRDTRMRG